MRSIILYISIFCSCISLHAKDRQKPSSEYVSVHIMGQFGNQLFQIAAGYAYALDHNAALTVPQLQHESTLQAKQIFSSRISSQSPSFPSERNWNEPSFNYHRIPNYKRIHLTGYFQSEKYFKHRRDDILDLFKMPQSMLETISSKYPFLQSDALVVGVQIRDYRKEAPTGNHHPTKHREYYEAAMSYFPEDTIFVVSSNNSILARECTEGLRPNIIYLNADYLEEFYTLSLCKSFIIGNSSYGWWAAWLSTAKDKTVIAPGKWFSLPYDNEQMTRDIWPEEWIILDF